jgi:hypothetical protein
VDRVGTFLDGLLLPFASTVAVRLVDLDAKKLVYGTFSPEGSSASYEDAFTFGGRHYGITTVPTASYLDRHRRWQGWAVLLRGVIGTGLLGALLLLGTGYTRRMEAVVEDRTRDLEATNRRLQLEIEERSNCSRKISCSSMGPGG